MVFIKQLISIDVYNNILLYIDEDVSIHDETAWSGTISHLTDILGTKYEVASIEIEHNFMEKICKGIQYIISGGNLKKGNILQFYNRRRLQQKINDARCDVLFAPASSELIACGIPRSKKLIYLSDLED